MNAKLTALAALAFLAGRVMAADAQWVEYAESESKIKFMWLPEQTTKLPSGNVVTWVKETYPNLTPMYPNKPQGPKVSYTINRMELDCAGQQFRYMLRAFYSKAGDNLGSEPSEPFQAAIPSSIGSTLLRTVCAATE